MVILSNEQVGLMVEDICGEVVRTNFEDAECGLDPMHPSDIGCSSMKDGDSSDDDEIKELFAEPALPAKAKVWDVESAEVVADLSPPTVSRDQDNRCTAGNFCGTKKTPLTIGSYMCLHCHKKGHWCLCGSVWTERGDDCRVRLEDLTEQGRANTALVGALICFGCMGT